MLICSKCGEEIKGSAMHCQTCLKSLRPVQKSAWAEWMRLQRARKMFDREAHVLVVDATGSILDCDEISKRVHLSLKDSDGSQHELLCGPVRYRTQTDGITHEWKVAPDPSQLDRPCIQCFLMLKRLASKEPEENPNAKIIAPRAIAK
jgi:hypothetical protein